MGLCDKAEPLLPMDNFKVTTGRPPLEFTVRTVNSYVIHFVAFQPSELEQGHDASLFIFLIILLHWEDIAQSSIIMRYHDFRNR